MTYAGSMFNEYQQAHMRYLASVDPERRCWSGWCVMGRDGWQFCCSPNPCPIEATLAERLRRQCECCGNWPDFDTGRMTHLRSCTRETRREYYATVELGGESG